ncbi:MAG: [protein-PII] uridylyltransferase, partial [Sciscionella sp.]
AQVIDRPDGRIRAGLALLLDVRGELHRVACRARDQLRAQDGDEVASALRVGDRFDLARLLSQTGRQVSYAVDVALRSVRSTLSPRRGVRTAPQRRPLADGVVLHSTGVSEVVLARSARVGGDPALVLRVAAAAARTATPISAGTLATLAKNASKPLNPWPDAMRGELIALLAAGPGLIEVVQALDATGLWGRLFPEWVAVADLPARDAAHIWTVDRHLLQTTVVAARMVTSVSRPDLLLLGALLHDIGKGRADDHSVLGARIVEQVGLRLGYSEPDVRLLRRLVRHHLLLPHTATRRDIGDPLTVSRVVEELNGDPVLLELLHYLTMADSQATGPGVWTEWRAALLDELVSSVRARISGVDDPLPSRIGEAATTLAQRAATTRRPELTVEGPERNAIVRIAATEQPGLLSVAAGVLVLGGVDVHSASLHRYRDISVGEFTVSPRFGALPDAAMLREQFRLALGGAVALAERIAAKERDYPPGAQGIAEPRVRWFDNESSAAPVLELRAVDRIGLLYRVAATLEHLAITVVWARVSTLGGTAIDSFCVLDGDPAAADPLRRKRITDAVLAAVR